MAAWHGLYLYIYIYICVLSWTQKKKTTAIYIDDYTTAFYSFISCCFFRKLIEVVNIGICKFGEWELTEEWNFREMGNEYDYNQFSNHSIAVEK